MTDLLRLGTYSIQALQQGLTTTGHNISNAGTEGYSRQTVNYETQTPQKFGFGFIGNGARVASVERAFNEFLTSQVRSLNSSASQQQVFSELSTRLEQLFADGDNNLNGSIQNFFDAIGSVNTNPSGIAEREVMLSEARSLVDRYQSYQTLLQDINRSINADIQKSVDEINSLSSSLAKINTQIVELSIGGSGAKPNDLLDQRDRLLEELASYVEIQVVEQSDSSLNVMIGNGQALVIGGGYNELKTNFNSADGSKLEVGVASNNSSNDGSPLIQGGQLQGMLDFRDRVLSPAKSELGLIALGLTDSFNTQHQLGIDLNGNAGSNFFQPLSFNIAQSGNNAGTTVPNLTINDTSQVHSGSYSLTYDGAQWQLRRDSDGTAVTGAGPLSLDGMTIDVSVGVPISGDRFVIDPGSDAGENFGLALIDGRQIAAASALTVETSLANTGNGGLNNVVVDPTNTLPLAGPITLSFDPDALGAGVPGFNIVGGPGGTIAYDPGSESAGKNFTFAAEGFSFSVSGVPAAGDSFVINNNSSSLGDGSNLLKLGELQHQSLLNGGAESFQGMYGVTVARIGVNANEASRNLEVESTLKLQAESQLEGNRGVNLDEEAARLIQLQQAYQASAQMIKVADDLFQTLISSVR